MNTEKKCCEIRSVKSVIHSEGERPDKFRQLENPATTERETRRRDGIALYRRKYIAGNAALKQLVARPTSAFAEALWCHIVRSTRFSPSDRALFNLDPSIDEVTEPAIPCGNKESGNCSHRQHQPSFSWICAFCDRLRIFEGGRPYAFHHFDICTACGSRVAAPEDRAALTALIDQHLL